nr:non-ribosomal peptide synthetase [Gordonia sp. NB41Y]
MGAALAGLLPTAGLEPARIAAATREAIADIRARAARLAGTDDLCSLPGLFRSSVARFGDRVAVTDLSGRSLTYRELDERFAELAGALLAAGAGPETLIGVAVGRTTDLVVALLGVLRSGAGYLPLDRSQPIARIRTIVDDAAPLLVLTDTDWADGGEDLGVRLTTVGRLVGDEQAAGPAATAEWRAPAIDDRTPAYVIYTSGSTGTPKGVVVTHADVVALMAAAATEFDFSHTDVWTMFHSYAFDFSVWELWGPLLTGARLLILGEDVARDPRRCLEVLAEQHVTVLSQTPSAFYQLGDARRRNPVPLDLRYIVFGGEALSFEQVRRWYDTEPAGEAVLVNMYGITETTVHVSHRALDPAVVTAEDASFIGHPLPSLRLHLLDSRLRPVPTGVVGEMYVAGSQLARGYLDRHGLTAGRFVADPFAADGSRMYRTGDLARRVGDDIEYLGRGDAQVQLRGFRIEYGEIEAAMLRVSGVVAAAAAVVDQQDRGGLLAGYVVAAEGADVDGAEVRRFVARAVPEYMVPDVVTVIDRLPLTGNGKLDRQALPRPVIGSSGESVEPATDTERRLAVIFADVLGLDRVGVTESIFDIGGNSLLAARIVGRATEELGVDLTVRDLFEAPSVRELAERSAESGAALPPIVAGDRPERIPLSLAQQRMWFLNRLDPTAPTYNVPAILELTGDLDVAALRRALADVITRHEVLRTTYPSVDGVAHQHVHGVDEIASAMDWAAVGDDAALRAAATTGFDVTAQWPVRVRLLRRSASEHVVALVLHHIACDGESLQPLVADLLTAYRARISGAEPDLVPLAVQVADHAVWQQQVLGDTADPDSPIGAQLSYWADRLDGVAEVIEIPTDRPRPAVASHRGARVEFTVPQSVSERAERLARTHDASGFMVAHAALAVLLARLSASTDIVVGTPIAGRGQSVLDPVVGMFVNTLALRTDVRPDILFAELISATRDVDLAALANADVPFEAVVDRVDPIRSAAFAPLAQVWLAFDQSATTDLTTVTLEVGDAGGLRIRAAEPDDLPSKVDLTLGIAVGENRWRGTIGYATDLFDEATARQFGERFVRVLDALTAHPELPVGAADILSAAEHDALEAAAAGPRPTLPEFDVPRSDVTELIGAGLRDGDPGRTVVTAAGRTLTAAGFGARVAALAHRLIAAGIGPDDAVGVCIPRSPELLVAIHAVVCAGGAYVPMDPDAPAARIAHMVAATGAGHILVGPDGAPPAVRALVGDVPGTRVLSVDPETPIAPDMALPTAAERRGTIRPDTAAYILFTSGSTGQPKGVTVSHRSLANLLSWFGTLSDDPRTERVLVKTPATFDASVWELFWPVISGATAVLAGPDAHRDPRALRAVIAAEQVTMAQFVPSMLAVFLDDAVAQSDPDGMSSIRTVFTGGELLAPAVARRALEAIPGARLIDQYGPTEATVDATIAEVASDTTHPGIGRPVAGTTARVLDTYLHPVPVGVTGELYLGGAQVARGYAGQPGLTAERFVPDPFGTDSAGDSGGRLYRTGDLVRRRADGSLEYVGRSDFQVKLHGQRIELEEVESVLAGAPGVAAVAAAVVAGPAGDVLVAHVAGVAGGAVDVDSLRSFAAENLVEFLRPSIWQLRDSLPRNASGKVDRSALPAPEFTVDDVVAPASTAEQAVEAVVASVLGVAQVSVTASFFDLGGNSLAATRVAARTAAALGVDVSVRDVFDAPSVRELVALVASRGAGLPPVRRVDPRPAQVPLSFAQRRIWFINQFDTASPAYNLPIGLRLRGAVDLDALRQAVGDVVERHEVLRTTFPSVDGHPVQQITDPATARARLDWAVVDDVDALHASAATGFDVATTHPLRVRVAPVADPGSGDRKPDDRECVLLLVIHHIAGDGQSMRPLVTDMVGAYQARARGVAPEFTDLPLQFADHALWQHEVLGTPDDPASLVAAQLDFWRARLAGLPDLLPLPTDRRRPPVASQRGAEAHFAIPAEVGALVRGVAAANGVTEFMVIHAALAVFLSRMSATDDIAIGTPIAGRGQAELDDLVGMFVNTLVLRTVVDPAATFAGLLGSVRSTDLDAFAHADVTFEAVVDALDPTRSEAFAPLTQVLLTYQPEPPDVDTVAARLDGLEVEILDIEETTAKVDLTIGIGAAPDGPWSGVVNYATDLFTADGISVLCNRFVMVLGELVAAPERAVGDVAVTTAGETPALTPVGGRAGTDPVLLADIFTDAARRHPDHPAVTDASGTLTYRELDEASNALARMLIDRGAGPESLVALGIGRSTTLMTAIWAVAKTGAGYVPIDPDYPADRVVSMIEDSGAAIGLTVSAAGELPGHDIDWITLDSDPVAAEVATRSRAPITDADRLGSVGIDSLAYVIYTSGSTGRPKGVAVTHRGLLNFATEEIRRADSATGARVLGFASPSFDASVLEYLLAFVGGGTLIYRAADVVVGHDLAEFIGARRITHTFLTPTVLASLDPATLTTLRTVYAGGEAVPDSLVEAWAPHIRIQNLYGPTETTIGITIGAPLRSGAPVTLGGPLDGVGLTILDSRLHPVPVGVLGELYVTGLPLSRGYLARPGLTAERFVATPFGAPGERMYRTGDVVRWVRDADGDLTVAYGGRSDDQIKLRGLRIELGEIESILARHDAVETAVVVGITADGAVADSGESVVAALAAYVVAPRGTDVTDLRGHLERDLPVFMVPSSFTVLEALPLTPVGKLDRRALPRPVLDLGEGYVAPAGRIEQTLAGIVAGLLGLDRVGATDSFFALGGDSIMSIQFASAARSAGVDLTPRQVFEHRTIRSIAVAVARADNLLDTVAEPATDAPVPLPPIVSWMLEHSDTPDDHADFSQSMVLVAPDGLTGDDLARTLSAVVTAHPMMSAALLDTHPHETTGVATNPDAGARTSVRRRPRRHHRRRGGRRRRRRVRHRGRRRLPDGLGRTRPDHGPARVGGAGARYRRCPNRSGDPPHRHRCRVVADRHHRLGHRLGGRAGHRTGRRGDLRARLDRRTRRHASETARRNWGTGWTAPRSRPPTSVRDRTGDATG